MTAKRLRKCVTELLAAIDRGEVQNGDEETMALAVVCQDAGLHDLVTQLAERTPNGRAVLKEMGKLH